jgi:hypothetical protein
METVKLIPILIVAFVASLALWDFARIVLVRWMVRRTMRSMVWTILKQPNLLPFVAQFWSQMLASGMFNPCRAACSHAEDAERRRDEDDDETDAHGDEEPCAVSNQ